MTTSTQKQNISRLLNTEIPEKGVGKISISLVKGVARTHPKHRATVRSLGLKRLGQTIIQPDNAAIRGMLKTVHYLVHIEIHRQ